MRGATAPVGRVRALALASVLLGALGVTAVVGLVAGLVALALARRRDVPEPTRTVAIVGVALSGVACLLGLLLLGPVRYVKAEHQRRTALALKLRLMRTAIADFKTDTGVYPVRLTDITAEGEWELATVVPPGTFRGPYFPPKSRIRDLQADDPQHPQQLPRNPYADPNTPPEAQWTYDATRGEVRSAVVER